MKLNPFFFLVVALLCSSGCAAAPHSPVPPVPSPPLAGAYHRVLKGETLWRIAKTHNVEMEELVRLNRISDASAIEVDQLIFIPEQKSQPQPSIVGAEDDFIWPLKGRVINFFNETDGNNMINKGINIDPQGSGRVLAARSGKAVFYSDNFGSFGKTVIIEHADGICTVYARNKEVFIKPGDKVLKGALIGDVGSAGRDKEDYLHFEVREGHRPKNPLFYLPR